jgi:hypothetical protein
MKTNAEEIKLNIVQNTFILSSSNAYFQIKGDIMYLDLNRVGLKDFIDELDQLGWGFEAKDGINEHGG